MGPGSPTTPGWHFRRGKLLRFEKDGVIEVLRGWPAPLAWRRVRGGPWHCVRPVLRLQDVERAARGRDLAALEAGTWTPREAAREARPREGTQCLMPFVAPAHHRIAAGLAARRDAARAFLDTIPAEVRRRVRRFRERQWHVLALLARCPGAGDLVDTNPALAWAIASNWVFHRPAVRHPMRAARRLVRIRRREAAGWLGFPPTEASVRALAKLPARALDVRLVLDLRRALYLPATAALLPHVRRLGRGSLVLVLMEATRPSVTPRLLQELGGQARLRDGLSTYARLAEALTWAAECGLAPPRPFKRLAQIEAFHEAMAAAKDAQEDIEAFDLSFPHPPLRPSESIEALDDPRLLALEGRVMRHCAKDRAQAIREGRAYLYRVLAPSRATLELRATADGWRPAMLLGPMNREVDAATRRAVVDWFVAARHEEERHLALGRASSWRPHRARREARVGRDVPADA